ncbi:hypothetical protein [Gluconobacter kondonii]|uniref:hypothetical protein n=1 Tax=Gluconobacter kondonii TaxID=941463 RepID=UPI001B8C3991|nr:hypothetical protein [Gluconobacter kondonii]MBS1080832.1 hypothetical protein [Gluconobacter kondonii]
MAAPLLLDMVLETATNPGTASFVLNGAVQDRRSFASAAPSGGQVFYFADDGTQAEWGVGTLTVGTPNMLSRQSIAGTTQNTTQALNFTGTVRVYSWLPSAYTPRLDGNGLLGVSGLQTDTLTVGKTAIVPAVSDWTTYQAVGAKDAYGAFLRLGGTAQISSSPTTFSNGLNTALGVSAWSTTNTQVLSVGDAYGSFLRLGGTAQTSSAPTTFTNGLAGNIVYAGALKGYDGATYVTAQSDIRMGEQTLYCNLLSTDGGADMEITTNFRMGGYRLYCNNIQSDGGSTRTIGGNTVVSDTWNFGTTPTVNGTNVALTSDLPLSVGQRIEAFTVSNVYSSTRINFPTGFSATPQSVIVCDAETGNQILWCKAKDWDAGGFTFMANAGNTCPLVSVIAIGNS